MFHNTSQFRRPSDTPPPVNYVVKFLGEPVFASPHWSEVHAWTLLNGFAVLALGCIWTKMPGVTIQHPTVH